MDLHTVEGISDCFRGIARHILRNIEMLFYFVFAALCITGFVLPHVMDANEITCYTVGSFSVVYIIGLYFLRYKMKVKRGLALHSAVSCLFSGFLVFDSELFVVSAFFFATSLICIGAICLLYGLDRRVAPGNQPPVDQAWDAQYHNNPYGEVEDQIILAI